MKRAASAQAALYPAGVKSDSEQSDYEPRTEGPSWDAMRADDPARSARENAARKLCAVRIRHRGRVRLLMAP